MDLCKLTAHESMDLLAKKEVTSQELTRAVIERIETVDKQVESYITNTFDYAMETAKAADAKIAAGEKLAPLEGVPMAIKDTSAQRTSRRRARPKCWRISCRRTTLLSQRR